MFRLINYESVLCSWLRLALKSPRTISKNGFPLKLKPGSFRSYQKSCKIVLRLTMWSAKCNKTTKFVSYCQRNAMHSSKRRTPVTFKGSFYSKYKYHHAFCWMGDQSVSNNILRFPSFHHQYWNQHMSLISRLCHICVYSHKLWKDTTLFAQNYVHKYCWGPNDIFKESV